MNLTLLLDSSAAARPAGTAVVDGGAGITYAELRRRADAWARRLLECEGTGPAVHLGAGGAIVVELLFGTAVAGRPFAPLNYRLGEGEIADLLRRLHPAVIVVEERNRAKVEAAAGAVGCRASVLDPAYRPPPAQEPVQPPFDPDLPALYLATSGTTSRPKIALLTHANLFQYVVNTAAPDSAAVQEAVLISAPPYHVATAAQVLSNVFRCRRVRFMAQFDARSWLELVRDEGITHAMVVPTMLARILDALEREPDLAPGALTTLSYGGSKAPAGLIERALRLLPGRVGLVNAFGLTETASTVSLLGPEDHRTAFASSDPAVRARLGSVGRVIPGLELRIRRPDGGWAEPGEAGEVCIRGPHVSPGYLSDSAKVDADGWLQTADRGHLDADGFLFLSGRQDDVIIRGGENIDPSEIEETLSAHPLVQEAVVFGVPDPEWGEVVAALVAGDPGVEEADLQAWVRARLAGYKVPVAIGRVAELPRNDMGKVVRRAARPLLDERQQV